MNSLLFVITGFAVMEETHEIIVSGKGSDISSDFYEPIDIPIDRVVAKLGIKSFSTYNNIPNVIKGYNNQLKIKVPGEGYKIVGLETGAYELETINEQLIYWIGITYPKLKNVEKYFELLPNFATSKADFVFKDDYGVDFNVEASMNGLLGFNKADKIEGVGKYSGEGIVNITSVTQLIFNCNITKSNYIDGKEMPFLYNCGVNVPAGFRLARELTDIAYKDLNTTQISHLRIWILDEHGAPVNLRDENLTVTLSLKLIPLVTPVSLT